MNTNAREEYDINAIDEAIPTQDTALHLDMRNEELQELQNK